MKTPAQAELGRGTLRGLIQSRSELIMQALGELEMRSYSSVLASKWHAARVGVSVPALEGAPFKLRLGGDFLRGAALSLRGKSQAALSYAQSTAIRFLLVPLHH